jgi:hypothetical protein
MDNKNPLLIGLLNVLIPGSSQWFVNKDRSKFIKALLVGIAIFVIAILTANTVQHSKGYALPQGLCMGSLVMVVAVALFVSGYRIARERSNEKKEAAYYNSRRNSTRESDGTKQAATKKMRDEGLISEQEYDKKNEKTEPNKK